MTLNFWNQGNFSLTFYNIRILKLQYAYSILYKERKKMYLVVDFFVEILIHVLDRKSIRFAPLGHNRVVRLSTENRNVGEYTEC